MSLYSLQVWHIEVEPGLRPLEGRFIHQAFGFDPSNGRKLALLPFLGKAGTQRRSLRGRQACHAAVASVWWQGY